MQLSLCFLTLLVFLLALVERTLAAYNEQSTVQTDLLAAKALAKLSLRNTTNFNETCTLDNAAIRREWASLSNSEKVSYTDAVLCLMSTPSITDPTIVPGARSRYDDFVATHINQTLTIHGTANFLSWHRYFVWTFETALRNECGYKGYQPYWNWGKSAEDPINSPYFDGSEYSIGGNGVYEVHNETEAIPTGLNPIPPGVGGGCVVTGPFKNMSVNLGPVSPTLAEPEIVATTTGFEYNPRCLKRDVNPWVSTRWSKDNDTADLISNYTDILSFQNRMQGDFSVGFYGVHTAGHFTGGGDPSGDIFASPGDPIFWLHHGQIDRSWWIWQNLDAATRQYAIGGTITLLNSPPSRNGTLDDLIDLGVNAPGVKIRTMMNTLARPLCYIYV